MARVQGHAARGRRKVARWLSPGDRCAPQPGTQWSTGLGLLLRRLHLHLGPRSPLLSFLSERMGCDVQNDECFDLRLHKILPALPPVSSLLPSRSTIPAPNVRQLSALAQGGTTTTLAMVLLYCSGSVNSWTVLDSPKGGEAGASSTTTMQRSEAGAAPLSAPHKTRTHRQSAVRMVTTRGGR